MTTSVSLAITSSEVLSILKVSRRRLTALVRSGRLHPETEYTESGQPFYTFDPEQVMRVKCQLEGYRKVLVNRYDFN